MKLSRVEIQNFRSIADLTLLFEHGCQALIGINESGKLNILRALQLLDPDVPVRAGDLRMERSIETDVVESGFVRFVFRLDDAEVEELYETLSALFEKQSVEQPLLLNRAGAQLSLKQLCYQSREGIYRVDLPSGDRVETAFT